MTAAGGATLARPGFGPAWLRALLLLLVFVGLNTPAFACPAAMAHAASASPARASVQTPLHAAPSSCHEAGDASTAAAAPAHAPGTGDTPTSAKNVPPACCIVGCAPAVPPLVARAEPPVAVLAAERSAIVPAALAGVLPSMEKPPPRVRA